MNELLRKIAEKRVQAGVIGMGYVGLPLAVEIANAGIQVVGIDLDRSKVERINAGTSYIPDVPSAVVEKHVNAKRLRAVADFEVIRELETLSSHEGSGLEFRHQVKHLGDPSDGLTI